MHWSWKVLSCIFSFYFIWFLGRPFILKSWPTWESWCKMWYNDFIYAFLMVLAIGAWIFTILLAINSFVKDKNLMEKK